MQKNRLNLSRFKVLQVTQADLDSEEQDREPFPDWDILWGALLEDWGRKSTPRALVS